MHTINREAFENAAYAWYIETATQHTYHKLMSSQELFRLNSDAEYFHDEIHIAWRRYNKTGKLEGIFDDLP